jgi:hypothetical protein
MAYAVDEAWGQFGNPDEGNIRSSRPGSGYQITVKT